MTKLLTAAEAAERLGIAKATLAKMRLRGGGPPFLKFNSKVLYDTVELEEWVSRQPRFRSTSSRVTRDDLPW